MKRRRCSNGTGTTCKIRAHRIKREEAEQALLNDPIPIYEQDVEGELRVVYYGETTAGRLLAVIVTERRPYLSTPAKDVIVSRGERMESPTWQSRN